MATDTRRRLLTRLLVWTASLAAIFLIWEQTPLDLWFQDLFYNFEQGRWLIDRHERLPRAIFYYGMKYGVILIGLTCLVVALSPTSLRKRLPAFLPRIRRPFAAVVFAIAAIPAFVGHLKNVTDVYFPSQITRYGGEMPYVRVFEEFPENIPRSGTGHGFPAGHASGGFALFSLVLLVEAKYRRRLWWTAFAYGCLMAAYQTVNGAHYISHTLVTIHIAWIFTLLIALLFKLDPLPPPRRRLLQRA